MIRMPEVRRTYRTVTLLAVALVFCFSFAIAQDDAAGDPDSEPAVSAVQRLLDALVDAASLDDVNERFELLTDAVVATHDLDYIGQLTVRRQWRDWDEAQRSKFLDAFSDLSVMNYAARFGNVTSETFEMLGTEAAGGARVQVNVAVVRADDEPVPLNFVLQNDGEHGWRIANVIADGVSDLALKRAEYRRLLEDSGFDGLVQEIIAQTRTMSEDEI